MPPVSSQRIGNIEGRLDRLDAKVDALGSEVTDPEWDSQTDRRQYGVLTMHNGFVRAAGFTTPTRQGTTAGEDGVPRFAGVMADPSRGVSAQGNTLASNTRKDTAWFLAVCSVDSFVELKTVR